MIICRTPFRISFFGGGTDYPEWYRAHGGAVLAATIDKYCYLTCRYLPPFFQHRLRIVYRQIETCTTIDEIGHPLVRETLRFLHIDRGIELHRRHLRIMKELDDEALDVLSSGMDICAFGDLLHEAWQAKRSLSPA